MNVSPQPAALILGATTLALLGLTASHFWPPTRSLS